MEKEKAFLLFLPGIENKEASFEPGGYVEGGTLSTRHKNCNKGGRVSRPDDVESYATKLEFKPSSGKQPLEGFCFLWE